MEIDNSDAERALGSVAIARRNYLLLVLTAVNSLVAHGRDKNERMFSDLSLDENVSSATAQ